MAQIQAKPSITSHGLFPAIVAVWFATLFGLGCLVLPSVALSLDAGADIARQLRTSLVGALTENYVIGARVHGLSPARIVFRHALPNATAPALSALGVHVPRLVGGAVITEVIFGMPGLGRLANTSALQGVNVSLRRNK